MGEGCFGDDSVRLFHRRRPGRTSWHRTDPAQEIRRGTGELVGRVGGEDRFSGSSGLLDLAGLVQQSCVLDQASLHPGCIGAAAGEFGEGFRRRVRCRAETREGEFVGGFGQITLGQRRTWRGLRRGGAVFARLQEGVALEGDRWPSSGEAEKRGSAARGERGHDLAVAEALKQRIGHGSFTRRVVVVLFRVAREGVERLGGVGVPREGEQVFGIELGEGRGERRKLRRAAAAHIVALVEIASLCREKARR